MAGWITLAVEGRTDEAVGKRLLAEAGLEAAAVYGLKGKHHLDAKLDGYNRAAQHSRWLALRDLDRDESCAPALRARLLPSPASGMRLHVVVHAVEAWLLADHEALAEQLGVRRSDVPSDPESLTQPKHSFVELARTSRRSRVRDAMVPAAGSTARVGPGYAAIVTEFATRVWRPQVAAGRSPSLDRLLRYLDTIGG